MKKERKKIVIALSGGVDSSVSSFLLKEKGYKVSAIFMKLINSDSFKKAEKRASMIAKKLDIDFKVVDLRKEFKKRIIDYFIESYKSGITPNPCIICNREIKFGLLFNEAMKMGADYIATGHYAKIIERDGKYHLLKPKDNKKDQTYFLSRLSQKQLSKIIFPLSNYTKDKVKEIAKKQKFFLEDVPESQEACFVIGSNEDFLKKYLKKNVGKIVDVNGKILGEHDGLWLYTIGQRKGIGLAQGPYFVVKKDIKKNLLIVSKNEKDLLSKELKFKDANFINKISFPQKVTAKIRYGHIASPGILSKNKMVFNKKQRAITPGQSVVFYKGKEMIGGGIII